MKKSAVTTRSAWFAPKASARRYQVAHSFLVIPSLEQLVAFNAEDDRLPEIRRCDDKGCTPVAIQPSASGAFLNMISPGYMLKLAEIGDEVSGLERGTFVEATTLWLAVYVSHGSCRLPRQ